MGSSERAGNEDGIAGLCSGAAKGVPGGCRADEDDVGEDEVGGRLGGVAACERSFVLLGKGAETVKEAFDPSLASGGAENFGGECEGEEGGNRCGSHGGEVAQAAGEAAMADGGGGVKVATEVSVLEGEVGGDEDLVATGRMKDGAVVADAEGDGFIAAAESAANLLDEGQFAQRLRF
jgi:hypothetical protein